ncbi:hypothetical protein [uncultured Desulfobulbus sp.]|uniref:hypothetical protein n=1 Tax=uncultured Desulfobulbus sp. TaxID=239745 RepID=UPI0029C78DC1|nr:hypothetical protein [uncultured Desulfobulbus sp.]
MKRILCLLFILIFSVSVVAQTTVPAAAPTAPPAKDVRLDKKVSLSFNSGKLEDILASMSKSSGIDFTAGNNDRDWRVRERKVTIYAKDISVGSVMDELSKLLGYRVSRQGKENQWSYLFWQDLKSKQLEAEMVTAAKADAADRAMKLRQSALDSAQAALDMSQEDALKLKDTDPWTAYLGGTKSGRGFASLMEGISQFSPVESDLMLRGQGVNISLDSLPANVAQAANDSTSGGFGGMIRQMAQGQLDNVRPSGISFLPMGELGGGAMAGMAGFGGMAIITGTVPGMPDMGGMSPFGGGVPLGIFPITSGNSLVGGVFGKMLFAMDEGKSLADTIAQVAAQSTDPDLLAESLARESVTEKNPPTDPDLTREIEVKDMRKDVVMSQNDPSKTKEGQGKMIEEISRAFGMPVIVEAFNSSMPVGPFVRPGKQPLYKVLVAFEKAGYIWEKGSGTFRVRPEDWALERSYEIPDAFIQQYKDILAKQGEFTLEDIANIAYVLTDDQIQNNLVAEPELTYALMGLMSPVGGSRGLLRVYGSLNNQQRAAIKSAQGLPFQQLSNVQWDRLNAVITDKVGGAYINSGSIRLIPQSVDTSKANTPQAAQMGTMNMAIFETTLQVNDEQKPRVLRDVIVIYGKQQLEMMKTMQKNAQDAAKKASDAKAASTPTK